MATTFIDADPYAWPYNGDLRPEVVNTNLEAGTVTVLLRPGSAFVEGVESPHSLMKASRGVYGEAAGEWTPDDARGFSKMLALPGIFYTRAGRH